MPSRFIEIFFRGRRIIPLKLAAEFEGITLYEAYKYAISGLWDALYDPQSDVWYVFCDEKTKLSYFMEIYEQSEATEEQIADANAASEPSPKSEPILISPPVKDKSGFVYLLHSSIGYYKIGRSISPEVRVKAFSVEMPFEIKLECLVESKDMHELELYFHRHFKDKRVKGEWFQLDAQDVEYIKNYKPAT